MRTLLLAGLAAALSLQAQPRIQSFTLPNGLKVLHLENHEHPLVRAWLHLRVDPADTPPGHQGLSQVAMQMFAASDVADRKAEELERLLEDSGIQLNQASTVDGLEWRLVARSRDQDRAMGLLADRLLRTIFDPSMLETQRLASWRRENQEDDNPHGRLWRALAQSPDTRPTFASLGTITWEDLLTFRAKAFRPDRAVLVLHGDLGIEQAKRLVLLNLGSWTVQEPPPPSEPPQTGPSNQPKAAPETSPRISAPGKGIRIQAVADPPRGLAPETAFLLRLLVPGNAALHPVRVTAEEGCLVATMHAEAGASASEAWSLLHVRLEAFRHRGFTQTDLDLARTAWQAGCSRESLDPEAQMEAALAGALGHGITAERMKAVSLQTLNEDLRNWLDPARLRSGAAGEPALLKLLPKP